MPVFNKAERNILHVLLYSFIYQQILFDFLQALLFNGRERLSVLEATQKAIDMFKCMWRFTQLQLARAHFNLKINSEVFQIEINEIFHMGVVLVDDVI